MRFRRWRPWWKSDVSVGSMFCCVIKTKTDRLTRNVWPPSLMPSSSSLVVRLVLSLVSLLLRRCPPSPDRWMMPADLKHTTVTRCVWLTNTSVKLTLVMQLLKCKYWRSSGLHPDPETSWNNNLSLVQLLGPDMVQCEEKSSSGSVNIIQTAEMFQVHRCCKLIFFFSNFWCWILWWWHRDGSSSDDYSIKVVVVEMGLLSGSVNHHSESGESPWRSFTVKQVLICLSNNPTITSLAIVFFFFQTSHQSFL